MWAAGRAFATCVSKFSCARVAESDSPFFGRKSFRQRTHPGKKENYSRKMEEATEEDPRLQSNFWRFHFETAPRFAALPRQGRAPTATFEVPYALLWSLPLSVSSKKAGTTISSSCDSVSAPGSRGGGGDMIQHSNVFISFIHSRVCPMCPTPHQQIKTGK